MERQASGDPNVILYRSGGGPPQFLLGFICVVLGAVFLGVVNFAEGQSKVPSLIAAGIFIVVGLCVLTTRKRFEIDTRNRTYARRSGILFFSKQSQGTLEEFQEVTVTSEVRQTDKRRTYTVYPVRLSGTGGRIELHARRSYESSRGAAETLARSVHLPLVDSSSGKVLRREPDRLDESLRDQARRDGPPPEAGDPPPAMKSRYEMEGKSIRFDIPRRPFSPGILVALVPFLVMEGVFLTIFLVSWREGRDHPAGLVAMVAVMVLAAIVPFLFLAYLLRHTFAAYTVEASPEALRVSTHVGPFHREVELLSKSIEDLDIAAPVHAAPGEKLLGKGLPIQARSDHARVAFGAHLPDAEKQWMVRVLKQVLTA
jgi:membrane protein YdbS with pleckstrin-like domain